jgi:hypothetical protein
MKILSVESVVSVQPGKYWLGDPCYSVPDSLWGDLLNSCEFFEQPIGKVTTEAGETYEVLAFGTKHGDGNYQDQDGHQFPVDAGLIGLTPVGLARLIPFGSLLVEFQVETECSEDDGVLRFGNYEINTRD